jgi:hypothetical protein
VAKTMITYDKAVDHQNETIRWNNRKITDLVSKHQNTTDPDQQAALTNQQAALTNQNTYSSNYLTDIMNARDDLMDNLNSRLEEEGNIYARRNSLVYSLEEIHTVRILDLYNGIDWYALEYEGSEPEGSEPEDSEMEGSETDDYNLNQEEDTKNNSDKGKTKMTECIDSPSYSEYSPESPGDNNSQDDMNRAMQESRREYRDHSANKNGESSKRYK